MVATYHLSLLRAPRAPDRDSEAAKYHVRANGPRHERTGLRDTPKDACHRDNFHHIHGQETEVVQKLLVRLWHHFAFHIRMVRVYKDYDLHRDDKSRDLRSQLVNDLLVVGEKTLRSLLVLGQDPHGREPYDHHDTSKREKRNDPRSPRCVVAAFTGLGVALQVVSISAELA